MASLRRRDRACLALALALALAAIAAAAYIAACGSCGTTACLQADYASAVRKALPSVVEINAGNSTGSGVVFDAKGDIVTNAHVVGTTRQFQVQASASSTPLPARLVGIYRPADLAVIKVTRGTENLVPADWAESTTAQVGDIVLAMGAPYGLVDSVTEGIVSATGRTVVDPASFGRPTSTIVDAIQTSAAINPGNSGGALVLLNGQVLGIPTLSAVSPQIGDRAQDIGFAIPSDTVRFVARQLIKSGRITQVHASVQMVVQTHTDTSGAANGVRVRMVQPGGAAARAGIRPGDVVVGIQGRQVRAIGNIDAALNRDHPGQKITMKVLRGRKLMQFTVTLGTEPP